MVPRQHGAGGARGVAGARGEGGRSRARYAAGELSLDVSGMREELGRKGLRYVDYEETPVIIDCHGHYTTVPAAHKAFRGAQLARLADPSRRAGRDQRRRDPRERSSRTSCGCCASAAAT